MRPIFSLKAHKRSKRIVGTPVVPDQTRVQLGASETVWEWASKGHRGVAMEWIRDDDVQVDGGLWVDSLGVQQGSTHYFTTGTNGLAAGSTNLSIPIADIPGDIYIKGIPAGSATGEWTVDIDGVPLATTGSANTDSWVTTTFPDIFWISQGTSDNFDMGPITLRNIDGGNPTGANPTGNSVSTSAIICKNPNRGTTLNLSWATPLSVARTVTANLAQGPLINDYPMGVDDGSAPTFYDYEPQTEADWNAFWTSRGIDIFAAGRDGSFGVDPDNGLKYVRFKIPEGIRNGLSAWKRFNPPLMEAYTQCTFMMENSVWENIHPDDSCKTACGPTQEAPWYAQDTWDWSMRGHHGGKSRNNPYYFSIEDYCEHQDSGPADVFSDRNNMVRCGRWILFDVYIKMNTMVPGVSFSNDGILRMWVNKNLIFEKTDIAWRNQFQASGNTLEATIEALEANFYQGGNDPGKEPLGDMWYKLARIRASTSPISIPPELVPDTPWPEWRVNIGSTVNEQVRLTGTAFSPPATTNSGVSHWSAPAITDQDELIVGASGGHNGSSDLNGDNGVYYADWRTDGPTAVSTLHAGTSDANSPDWTPIILTNPNRGPIDLFYEDHLNRAHYDADDGDVEIRPPSQNYTLNVYVPGNFCHDGKRRIFYLGLNAPRSRLGGTNSRRQVDAFRIDEGMWDASIGNAEAYPYAGSGTMWGDIPPAAGKTLSREQEASVPHVCFDNETGLCYWAASTDIYIFNPSLTSNHWSYGTTVNGNPGIYTHAGSGWQGIAEQGAMLIDQQRDRLVMVEQVGLDGARLAWFPKAGGAIQFTTISGITIGQRNDFINDNPGFTHDTDLDKYILVLSSAQGTSSIDYWYEIEPDDGTATLIYESASGEGCHNRAMGVTYSSFLKGCIYLQGGNVAQQQATRDGIFFPRQSTP